MAAPTRPNGANWKNDSRFVALWTLTDADPTGDWLECAIGSDKSVEVVFAAGTGTVTLHGSNIPGTPGNGFGLRDATHTALSYTSSNGHQILENTLKVRPVLAGGSGATVHVYLCVNGG